MCRHRDHEHRRSRSRRAAVRRRGGARQSRWTAAPPDRHRAAARRGSDGAQPARRLPVRPRRPALGIRGEPARAPARRGAAEALVDKDVGCYLDAHRSRRAVPLLVALRERGEEIRRTEIEKARRCLGPLTPDQERALDSATAAIVNKLLHTPTVYLKEMARAGQSDQQATLVRRVLGLA